MKCLLNNNIIIYYIIHRHFLKQAYNKCCIKLDDVSSENSDLYLTPKKVKIQEFKFVLHGKDVDQKLEVSIIAPSKKKKNVNLSTRLWE